MPKRHFLRSDIFIFAMVYYFYFRLFPNESNSYFIYFILIFTVCFFPLPSVAIAVIFTVFLLAAFFVVTIPLAFTVAYFVFADVQRSFVFAFFVAVILAFSFSFFPAFTGLFPVILTFFVFH